MSSVNDGNITKEPSDGGSGGASPPFAISDTTGLQTALDGKLEDVADIAAAINCGQTAGTSTAVTAAKTGLVLSDGLLISVIWTTTNGAAPTLNVNGTGARAIKKHTQSGLATISAAQLLGNFGTIVLVYNAADASWIVVSGLVMVDADLPATSNNSTISAISTVANAAIPKATVDAKGDLIVGTANDTVGRLAVGTNGQVLTADSAETTGAKWATVSATDSSKIPLSLIDAKGDIIAGTAADTAGRLPVGSNNQFLVADSGETAGLKYRALVPGDMPCGLFLLSSVSGTNTILATSAATPVAGMGFILIPANTISGSATLNLNSIGAVTLKRRDGSNLINRDLKAGYIYIVIYNGTNYVVQNPSARRRCIAAKSAQTLTANSVNTLTYDTPSENTLGLTYASGVWTATVDIDVILEFSIYSNGSSIVTQLAMFVGGISQGPGTTIALQLSPFSSFPLNLTAGDTFSTAAYPIGGSPVLSVTGGDAANNVFRIREV